MPILKSCESKLVSVQKARGPPPGVRGLDVAHVQVAVGELDLEGVGDVVGEAGMGGPGEVPMGVVLRRESEGGATDDKARVGQCSGLVEGAAGAGADERRQAPPGAEIKIEVGKEHRCLMIAVKVVEAPGTERAELRKAADRLELRAGAVFAGEIEAKPVVPLIADAAADEDGVLDVLLIDAPARRPDCARSRVCLVELELLEVLHADADVATQIPAAGFDVHRRTVDGGRQRRGQISGQRRRAQRGKRRRAQQRGRSGERQNLCTTHDIVLSSGRGTKTPQG